MLLVAGASSQPGRKLLPLLVRKGYSVRALTRDARKLEFAASLGVEVIEGDLRQSDTLLRACEGAEAVVSAVTGARENRLVEVDEAGNQALMAAALQAGAQRFVLVSAHGAAPGHAVDLLQSKYRIEQHLRATSLAYTILRPTAFMETWCTGLGARVQKGEWVGIRGNGRNPINFISVADVAKFILLALEDPRLRNQTLTIGGPQNLTWEEVAAVYERLAGRHAHKRYLPNWWLDLQCRAYAPFDPARARALALYRLLATADWRVDMSGMIRQYPIRLQDLEAVAREVCERT